MRCSVLCACVGYAVLFLKGGCEGSLFGRDLNLFLPRPPKQERSFRLPKNLTGFCWSAERRSYTVSRREFVVRSWFTSRVFVFMSRMSGDCCVGEVAWGPRRRLRLCCTLLEQVQHSDWSLLVNLERSLTSHAGLSPHLQLTWALVCLENDGGVAPTIKHC